MIMKMMGVSSCRMCPSTRSGGAFFWLLYCIYSIVLVASLLKDIHAANFRCTLIVIFLKLQNGELG